MLAPRLGLHAERFHLFKATITVIKSANDKDENILVLLDGHGLMVGVGTVVVLVVWLGSGDHLGALEHHLGCLVLLIMRVLLHLVLLVVPRTGLVPLVRGTRQLSRQVRTNPEELTR